MSRTTLQDIRGDRLPAAGPWLIRTPVGPTGPRAGFMLNGFRHLIRVSAAGYRRKNTPQPTSVSLAERWLYVNDFNKAGVHLPAMHLLGVNCGYWPTDRALLPLLAIDLATGLADYPCSNTEVRRLWPLWPETTAPLSASLEASNPHGVKLSAYRRRSPDLTR